jgi:cytochrome c-type biogenesis protein CcmI
MVLTAAVAIALGTILFTLLVRAKDVPETPPPSPTAHLEERKAQIYENLRDLQFEFRVGKLSDADYQKTKLDLQRELAKVLAEIDAVQPSAQAKSPHAKAAAATVSAKPRAAGGTCPHCGAKFAQPMKFCGECGRAMA